MRKGLVVWLLLDVLLAISVSAGADPDVRIPKPSPPAKVVPKDAPAAVLVRSDELYPVDCSKECVVRTYPAGVLAFDKWEPGTVYAKFAGGNGKLERKTFKGPFLYVGRVVGEGPVVVVVTPLGLKSESEIVTAEVDAGGGPRPPPPKPPTPDPVPPPKPLDPAPIPEPGFRVLIVYERDPGQLPPKQQSIIDGRKFRDFLDANCVKVAGQPEYRMYDKDVVLTGESEVWKKAMARPRTSVPWILVSNGTAGFEGPLPATVDEAIALASKYLPGGK